MKKYSFLVLVALVLVANPLAHAGHCNKCGGYSSKSGLEGKFMSKAHFMINHAEAIGISFDQLESIKSQKKQLKKDIIRMEADIDIVKIDIKSLMYDYPVNSDALEELLAQKYELKKAKAVRTGQAYADLKNTLNQGQYDKMKELWSS